ncbi:hypothetical protein EVAR_78638_1 [Eumeta japonica]|uniref:Uncharacterized protein n=1 Tax=Eumeta variegata TaxID=151549 RepID=A0A4C1U7U4_EUMVA|nr:hypothetical protein EVAR_78638_1 [Eumeta japonica]
MSGFYHTPQLQRTLPQSFTRLETYFPSPPRRPVAGWQLVTVVYVLSRTRNEWVHFPEVKISSDDLPHVRIRRCRRRVIVVSLQVTPPLFLDVISDSPTIEEFEPKSTTLIRCELGAVKESCRGVEV